MRKNRRLAVRACIAILALVAAAVWLVPITLKMAYPLRYREPAELYGKLYGVDPLLLISVMRVESNFREAATSPQGATGLMQLMPDTATWAAERLGLTLKSGDLLDPSTNIRLGAWYLAELSRQFDDDLPLALAAYNGGQANVERWLEQRSWSGQRETVDDIPFPETRRYVHKVLFTYDWYRRLYGEALRTSTGAEPDASRPQQPAPPPAAGTR